jgi:mono/diheme cytochrome c family protein
MRYLLPGLALMLLGLNWLPLSTVPQEFPTSFECRWTDLPITIDGEGNEAAWKLAQPIERFHKPWMKEQDQEAKAATRAKLLWDREYLYFLADMVDSDLVDKAKENDGALETDDLFELFFQPDRDKPGYFGFQANPLGTRSSSFFPKRDLENLAKYKSRFPVELQVKRRGTVNNSEDRDQAWTLEGRIPWTEFLRAGGRPVPGEEWNFALGRRDVHQGAKEPELSTIAPIREKRLSHFFHQHEDYAKLKFLASTPDSGRPFGIAQRIPLTTSTVVGSPEPPLPYRVKRILPHYSPAFPIMAKAVPGTDQLLLITQERPYSPTSMSLVKDDPSANPPESRPFMKTPTDGTAYDFAFHPQFAKNGYLYIGWNGSTPGVKGRFTKVTRYTLDPKSLEFDEKTATLVIEWPSDGHNGGALCFGKDGFLYITSGDGTSDSDVNLMGQRTDNLLCKLLRIDVDHPAKGKLYGIPKDNPFVGDKRFAPETFAYGLRNPWRLTSDPVSGQIWIGNNGQDLWETAYLAKPRDNYGWSVNEGSHPFYLNRQAGPTPFTKPTIEHHHSEFRSLTGGIVHRGPLLTELDGVYIYGDYSTGRIWGMKHNGEKPEWHRELATTSLQITGFGTDTRGNLLICDHRGNGEGALYTLEPTPKDVPKSTFPKKLSDSGLYDSVKGHIVKPGVIPYSVNAPFWSDGLYKERFIALPASEQIGFTRNRGWNFPDKTVIIKSFAIEEQEGVASSRKWIETRFLTKQGSEWFGYSYLWNEQGTDAELVSASGIDKTFEVKVPKSEAHPEGVRRQVWHYPSRSECMVCHTRAANFVLGLCELQMNKLHNYGSCTDNQLRVLENLNMLKIDWHSEVRDSLREQAKQAGLKDGAIDEYVRNQSPQPGQRTPKSGSLLHQPPEKFRSLVDPTDVKQDLTRRAKSWLHTNCSSCHVEAGGGNAQMELEYTTELAKMKILGVKPVHSTFEIPEAALIAPGRPDRSVLLKRVGTRGPNQMPPLSSNRVDELGLKLLTEWVSSLPPFVGTKP